MSVFDSINDASNKAIDQSEEFLKKSHEYYKLKIFQQLTTSISMVFKAVLIGGIFLIGLAFIAIALAFYVSSLLESYTLGFVSVSFFFFLFALLMYLFRSFFDSKVIQKVSKTFFK